MKESSINVDQHSFSCKSASDCGPRLNPIALGDGWIDAEVSEAFQYAIVARRESNDIGETARVGIAIAQVGAEVGVVREVKRFDKMVGKTGRL